VKTTLKTIGMPEEMQAKVKKMHEHGRQLELHVMVIHQHLKTCANPAWSPSWLIVGTSILEAGN